jgi:hypothetical protein
MNPFYNIRRYSNEHLWATLQRLTVYGCTPREFAKVYNEIMRRKNGVE